MGLVLGGRVFNVRRSPELVWDESGGEVVLINLNSGRYFSLNGSASEVWTHCLNSAELCAVSFPSSVNIEKFLETLLEQALVTAIPHSSTQFIGGNHDVAEEPQIEVHSDLAEMLLLDPIHDVDSQLGWPNSNPHG